MVCTAARGGDGENVKGSVVGGGDLECVVMASKR